MQRLEIKKKIVAPRDRDIKKCLRVNVMLLFPTYDAVGWLWFIPGYTHFKPSN